jgi:von Willebrand factor A domain-containing protein 8
MESVGLGAKSLSLEADDKRDVELHMNDNTLTIGSVSVARSVPESIEKVPRPLFYDNMAHRHVLQSMLGTHVSGRYNATLLIGNQGVGKNKLIDHMLALLRREREYIQLHRDTTVQSLTVLPSLQDGKIIYEDSPLLRAAKFGRVLVVDEADKAPVEVLCLLKMLAEDGELVLYDGRRLLSRDRIQQEFPAGNIPADVISIDEKFRLVVLANRPGFPFHGNNLFRECGDVFSIHVVENLDLKSEISLLQAYGPDVPVDIINRIAHAFRDLRRAYEDQEMSYPYSAREAVAVVKHVQAYPEDGVAAAVENIIGFEGYNPRIRKQIALIFQSKGIPVPIQQRLGGHADALSHRESVLANIILAPSRPVPAPMTYPVIMKLQGAMKCDVEAAKLPLQEWTSNVHKVLSFDLEQARLTSFRYLTPLHQ